MSEGASADEMLDPHSDLARLLEGLQPADPLEGLPARLAVLERRVLEHFADEEAPGGFFFQLREQDPQAAQQVEALHEEHAQLLAGLRGLAAQAAETAGSAAELAAARDAFVEAFRRHERAEKQLVAASRAALVAEKQARREAADSSHRRMGL